MVLLSMLASVAGLVKARVNSDKTIIDNAIFRLHYRTTTSIFFVCCILITANSLIGDPINCTPPEKVPANVINTYCWVTSTFTLPGQLAKKIGHQVISPGVGTKGSHGEEELYHAYYQWVPFVLLLQGILFYLPHWLWKTWEGGRLDSIASGLKGITLYPEERKEKQSRLVQYILDSLSIHNWYAISFMICEFFNLVNVLGNIFFINKFLKGAFLSYGLKVIEYSQMDQENRNDIMLEVFPRVTKCTFHQFGPSGTIQDLDSMCVLALNILNEKIYIFLWFWLIGLTIITALNLLYRVIVVFSPMVRAYVIQGRSRVKYLAGLDALVQRLQLGDFFVITMIQNNMDILVFREFLGELAEKLHLENFAFKKDKIPLQKLYPDLSDHDATMALEHRRKMEYA